MSRVSPGREITSQPDVPVLRGLGPRYEENLHGRHAAVLLKVLTDRSSSAATNIALAGHYGSGKSSVIRGVQAGLSKRKINWVNLSLSSLGIDDTKRARIQQDGTLPPLTNLIQKEIVKQLLYRKAPADMPGSRYFRIESFRPGPAVICGAAVAVGFFVIAVLSGLVNRVEKTAPQTLVTSHDWVPWVIVGGFGVFLGVIWFLGLRALRSRMRVESVSAGGAAVKLSAKENSYFDEYLDEIVYFFQKTKTQVAIFEDLDRFRDPHIFETLRELNTVLNNSEQIKSRPVRVRVCGSRQHLRATQGRCCSGRRRGRRYRCGSTSCVSSGIRPGGEQDEVLRPGRPDGSVHHAPFGAGPVGGGVRRVG